MALSVRRAGYHEWLKVEKSDVRQAKAAKDDELLMNLKSIKTKNKKYGTLRLRRGLDPDAINGKRPSYGKIYKLCKDNGLLQKARKPKSLTKADPKAQASEDLVKLDFTANESNKKWLSDLIEISAKDGKLYIAGVLDCYDGAIVGLSMADNMKAKLCADALEIAIKRYALRTAKKGEKLDIIANSDRSS